MSRRSASKPPDDLTIHVIFQSHIDPIWLWPWHAGLDTLLATCRSACDRLDANPDINFTRGEAWVYWQIEQVDPWLFQRIKKFIEQGRWEIVGGWWIQPDCNIPSKIGFERQIELGRKYFLDRFGQFPAIAYNVDSFGHAATLPTLMNFFGQNRYVMMRPQEHEMKLPARLFRWRESRGAPAVTTFRISAAYCTPEIPPLEHLRKSITDLPPGIRHSMCFIGAGDHGGGPTERTIAWCRENAEAIPGCKMVFSTVSRFFDAITPQIEKLPVVTGELQYHAVGCYTVGSAVKLGVRRGEHRLRQAEIAIEENPAKTDSEKLLTAWQDICFHQFHDTIGGTCIPSAYSQVNAQIGRAHAFADEILHLSLRRKLASLPDDPLQRLVFFNASDEPFEGFVEVEPWTDWAAWKQSGKLLDEAGNVVPCQLVESEAITHWLSRMLIHLIAKPRELRVLRIDTSGSPFPKIPLASKAQSKTAINLLTGRLMIAGKKLPMPKLQLIDDPSDTWSHGIDRYAEGPATAPKFKAPVAADPGPIMASIIQRGRIGVSPLQMEYRIYESTSMLEILIRIAWTEVHKILKLTIPFPAKALRRFDGIPGGELNRPLTGRESPVRDRTLIELQGGRQLGIVCPEICALDCTPKRLRVTLLRSPVMAHHAPHSGKSLRGRPSDRGEHEFRIQIFAGTKITGEMLDRRAMSLNRPLIFADLTRGMLTKK